MTWERVFIRDSVARKVLRDVNYVQSLSIQAGVPGWKDVWVTNCERLDNNLGTIFMAPPDYLYVIKFDVVMTSHNNCIQLFRHQGGKTEYWALCMRRQEVVFEEPRTRVLTVRPPIFEQGMLQYYVYGMNGDEIGCFSFRAQERITVKRFIKRVLVDMEPLPSNTKVFSINFCMCELTKYHTTFNS